MVAWAEHLINRRFSVFRLAFIHSRQTLTCGVEEIFMSFVSLVYFVNEGVQEKQTTHKIFFLPVHQLYDNPLRHEHQRRPSHPQLHQHWVIRLQDKADLWLYRTLVLSLFHLVIDQQKISHKHKQTESLIDWFIHCTLCFTKINYEHSQNKK